MLKITIPQVTMFDDSTQRFVRSKREYNITLEHSLVSISKWEAKYHKSFLNNTNFEKEELIYYIKCMTISQNVDEEAYKYITDDNIKQINDYISDSMTATTFYEIKNGKAAPVGPKKNSIITSEQIYYWMIACEIPFECQRWHLNRLLTLIRVCNIENNKGNNRMSKADTLKHYKALNAARRR